MRSTRGRQGVVVSRRVEQASDGKENGRRCEQERKGIDMERIWPMDFGRE